MHTLYVYSKNGYEEHEKKTLYSDNHIYLFTFHFISGFTICVCFFSGARKFYKINFNAYNNLQVKQLKQISVIFKRIYALG